MGLLDDDYVPPYQPPENPYRGKRYDKQTVLSQEKRDTELNNLDLESDTV